MDDRGSMASAALKKPYIWLVGDVKGCVIGP